MILDWFKAGEQCDSHISLLQAQFPADSGALGQMGPEGIYVHAIALIEQGALGQKMQLGEGLQVGAALAEDAAAALGGQPLQITVEEAGQRGLALVEGEPMGGVEAGQAAQPGSRPPDKARFGAVGMYQGRSVRS